MKKLFILLVVTIVWLNLAAQGVGIGTTTPDSSAALEVSSVTQGMLVPRMTSEQRNMISSPAQGLLVFDITSNTFWFRNTNSWVELVDSIHAEVHRSGPNSIYMGMNDNVGVGTMNPTTKFQVKTDGNGYGLSHNNATTLVSTYLGYTFGSIGTLTNSDFCLFAGSGKVGINTFNPVYPLHVTGQSYFYGEMGIGTGATNMLDIRHGSSRTGDHASNLPLYVTGDLGADVNGIEFRHNNGTQGIGFGFNTIYASGSLLDQDLAFKAKGTGSLVFNTFLFERMRITGDGYIGISTSTPHTYLQFGNQLTPRKLALHELADNQHQFTGFGTPLNELRYQVDSPASNHIFYAATSSASSAELMRIQGNGNVGIGVNAANHKLDLHTGPARTGSHPTGRALYVTGDLPAASNGVEFRHYDGTQGIGFGSNTIYAAGSSANQDLNLACRGTSSIAFKSNTTELMRIMSTGNVGIGSSTPDKLFSVANKFGVDANGTISYKNSVNTMAFMYEGQSFSNKMVISHSPTYQSWGLQYKGDTNSFRFLKDDNPVMSVNLTDNTVAVHGTLSVGYTIAIESIEVPGFTAQGLTCECPQGTQVTGGGYHVDAIEFVSVPKSYPNSANAWYAQLSNAGVVPETLTVYAICARIAN